MWETLNIMDEFIGKIDVEIVSQLDLEQVKEFIVQKR